MKNINYSYLEWASSMAAWAAFGTSSVISFGAGALGYAAEKWWNGRTLNFGTAMMHGGFVLFEGIWSFTIGGIVGSIGKIGTKGQPLRSKEWWFKLIFGKEFVNPLRMILDFLRNHI